MKINVKMLVYILSTSLLIFIISLGYVTIKSINLELTESKELANKTAKEYANVIKSELTADFNIAKTLAKVGEAFQSVSWEQWNKIFLDQQLKVIEQNEHFLAVATSWELAKIDPQWEKPHGRYLNGWVRDQNGEITQLETRLNLDGDDLKGNYFKMKSTRISMIVDPRLYSPTGKVEDQYLNSNISVPIIVDKQFVGLAGLDIDLHKFQELITEITPFENSYSFLVSNDGTFVAHPQIENMGKLIQEVYPEITAQFNVNKRIKAGENFSFTYEDNNKEEYFHVFAPVNIDGVDTPWSLAITVPYRVITLKAKAISYNAIFVSLIGFILLFVVIWLIARNISKPIIQVTKTLKQMAKGAIDNSLKMQVVSNDETGEMTQALNVSIDGLNKKAEFANQIGEGNINSELNLLGETDILGKSLLTMRDNLRKTQEEENIRKEEDRQRRWINEGLAKFADILRRNNDKIEILSRDIIYNLIQYVHANQGGLFIKDDDEENQNRMNLIAAYAFDREKYFKKQIEFGEGLVGTCAQEMQTIYITEIPQDYIEITSGLGGSNPNSLLIVPLKSENAVLGVIELASFNKFEKYEINFVEQVAESIASTLKSVQINIKTAELLERSQQQSEEMAAQEEEMRQNMEELQATQEESTRRNEEFESTLLAIDEFLLKVEFDLDFKLKNANKNFLKKLNYKLGEIIGLEAEEFVSDKDIAKFQKIINIVLAGNSHQEKTTLKSKDKKNINLIVSFTPVFINEQIDKILLLALDVKDYK